MKIKDIILSYDFFISACAVLVTMIIMPDEELKTSFYTSFYEIGINVLSIIFSLFFASLAIIMSSSDNDFIEFLEEKNDFTYLLKTFKFTLSILFISLMFSIVMSMLSEYQLSVNNEISKNCKPCFYIFEFLFLYSLLATALSVKDTIMYSHYRTDFIKKNKNSKENDN